MGETTFSFFNFSFVGWFAMTHMLLANVFLAELELGHKPLVYYELL